MPFLSTTALAKLNCDVLIIGSGPGGSISAYHLAAQGYDTMLVEEGPDTREAILTPYSSEEMNQRYRNGALTPFLGGTGYTYAEGRCLGGGSQVNSGFFHPPVPEILAGWSESNHIRSLSAKELEPHVAEIARELSIASVGDAYEGSSAQKLKIGADRLGWLSREVPRWISSIPQPDGSWQTTRMGMAESYLPKASASGARILTGVRIDRLTLKNGRAVEAHGHYMNGYVAVKPVSILFREVIVCAGAIHTPHLLRRSGIKANIGNSLQSHPMLRVIARFPDEVNEGNFGVPVRQVLEFMPDFTFGSSVSTIPHLSLWMDKGLAKPGIPLIEDSRYLSVYYALTSSVTRGRIRSLPLFAEPTVHLPLGLGDYERLAEGTVKLGRVLFEAGCTELYLPVPDCPVIRSYQQLQRLQAWIAQARPEASTIHLFGSCPLGEDPNRFPLDSFGKVQALDNIYVNDASMLPGCTGVNPQATLMTLAQRNILNFIHNK